MIRHLIRRCCDAARSALSYKPFSGAAGRLILACTAVCMLAVSGPAAVAGDGGEGGPGAFSPKTTRTVPQSVFVDLSRNKLRRLLERDAEENTQVVIEGFPTNQTTALITVTITARTIVRQLIRTLTNVEKDKDRTIIIEKAADVVVQRQIVLVGLLNRIQIKIIEEKSRDPLNKTKTPRLIVLEEEQKQLNIRLQKIRVVIVFLRTWAKNPAWGK